MNRSSFKESNKHLEERKKVQAAIKFQLGLSGFTLKSFAEKQGVKPGTLGVVFFRPYPRMERLIADTIGIPPQQIWPDRYGPDGRPNRINRWYLRGPRRVQSTTADEKVKQKSDD